MSELFECFSVLDDYHGHADVEVEWFCRRACPAISYPTAIVDYDTLPTSAGAYDNERLKAEAWIDGLFTRDEVEKLADYLRRLHGVELVTSSVMLPARVPYTRRGRDYFPLAMWPNPDELFQLTGSELRFDVWGRVDLDSLAACPMVEQRRTFGAFGEQLDLPLGA